MSYVPGGGYPDLATIRAWLKTAATVLTDADLEVMAAAEQTAQARLLTWPDDVLPDDLVAAFLRRVARHAAAKGIPLGVLGADAEFGAVRLSRWDAEVERLEGPTFAHAVG
jgi:hypothetical protein